MRKSALRNVDFLIVKSLTSVVLVYTLVRKRPLYTIAIQSDTYFERYQIARHIPSEVIV